MTTEKKVWFGFGTLILLLVISGLVTATQMTALNRDLEEIWTVHEPASAAANEMEIDLLGVGMGTMRYLATGEPEVAEQIARDSAGFDEARAEYDGLATDPGRKTSRQIGALFTEYRALSQSLLEQKRRENQVRTEDLRRFVQLRSQIDAVLDTQVQEVARKELQSAWEKGATASRTVLSTAYVLLLGCVLVGGATAVGLGGGIIGSEQTLRRGYQDSEKRIGERTAELNEANAALQPAVTGRRRAEAALEGKQNLLNVMLDNIEDGIVACDTEGNLTLFNQATRVLHGLPSEAIPAEQWAEHYDAYFPDGTTRMEKEELPLFRALRGERVRNLEMVVAPRQGPPKTLLASGQALRDARGEIAGAIVSLRDISERKQAEEELRRFTLKLQRSNRELEQFASIASHDLQEPLRKIQAFGDRLYAKHSEALGESGRDYVQRMQSGATRMRILIDDLLAFSRVTTKAQPFKSVDLSVVAREVVSDLEIRLQDTGGQVEIGALPTLHADPSQMRQLLQNLIANGLKFHRPGVPPVVQVEGTLKSPGGGPQPALWEIAVRDNGIGFEEVYLDRIFEVFQRLHGRLEYEGTGIGLAICRRIVERHGGVITARSAPGQGATFLVTLPVRQPDNEEVRDEPKS